MRLEFEPNASAVPFVEKEVVDQTPSPDTEKLLRDGVKAAQEGNRAEARNLLLRVTETDVDNENAWLWLASISEYPEELLVFLNNVLRVNPNNERALEWHKATNSLLAKTLVQRGIDALGDDRRDFARQCFEQALGHESENEMAWLWMASVADSDDEKVACFEKVLSVNPANEAAQASIQAIQAQKTQTLFSDALAAAFDGRHDDAKQLLEIVLGRNAELEDAWVLKSHIASSFEERAECFLKLRALNPENELANANLASWRALSNKIVEVPKAVEAAPAAPAAEVEAEVETAAETVFEPVIEAADEAAFEIEAAPAPAVLTEVAAAAETPVAPEFVTEETSFKELAAEFSAYPVRESAVETEPAAPVFTDEAETEMLEVAAPAPKFEAPAAVDLEASFFNDNDLYADEAALNEAPTQELHSADFAEQSFADLNNPAPAEPEPVEESVAEFTAAPAEQFENSFEEFQKEEVGFEAEESPRPLEAADEAAAPESELTAELEAEEAKMNWAFNETPESEEAEDYFRNFDDSDDDIHKTHSADVHETQFSNDDAESLPSLSVAQTESVEEEEVAAPAAFVDYAPAAAETSFAEAEAVVEEPAVTEEIPAQAVAAAFEPQPETARYFAETEESAPVAEVAEEEYFAADDFSPAAAFADARPAEQFAPQVAEPQPQEELPHPKSELVLCPFCNAENEKQAFSCGSCQTILTLSDLEMLLNQQSADPEKLAIAVGSLERENESYGLSAEQLMSLGIGQINLKNYRQGFLYLQEAVRMNPSNVLLDAQVNALAIRLSEIEEQQTAHDAMPKNRKILVVDDSPTVRKLISGKLEKCGHEVICAVDGVDALEKINELTPDLVLLDITMPRMDGYQVCKLIRNNDATKDVPVVMISGKDGFFDKVRGRMAGTTGYITKPFGPETLMKTVENYLN